MAATRVKAQLMTGAEVDRTLLRLAHEIVEKNDGLQQLAVIGIRRRGAVLGERLAEKIRRIDSLSTPVGALDITLYRDDLTTIADKPVVNGTEISFSLTGKDVVLVDDVLYTGRTTRAALDALFDHGRPRSVQLCALIDRGHRELPIEAQYVGKFVSTTAKEIIEVKVESIDGEERVLLVEQVSEE
jgi:pyrimidine operon attenuation protein/uracil phosphoribosyltransferase